MGPMLSSLVNLQVVETKLRIEQQKLKKAQQSVIRQEHHIKQLQEAFQAKREEIKLTRMQYDKLELELKIREEGVTKYRVALNTARTNKDYSAILTQINTHKADQSKLEDQILRLMDQIDADQNLGREIEQDIEAQQVRLQDIQKDAGAKQQVIQKEVDQLLNDRKQAGELVPLKEQVIFDRLAEHFDGEVLATVVQLDSRRNEHSCGGCFMSVTLESVNTLMTRDEIVRCPNCGRFLVLDINPKQQAPA